MSFKSSFPALKPLPGSKRSFPEIRSRVNCGRVNISKPDQTSLTLKASRQIRINNSSGSEVFFNRDVPLANKRVQPIDHDHDSSAVSACLQKQTCNPSKTTNLRSKILLRKPVVSCIESSSIKPKWNITTLIEQKKVVDNIPSLPGKKKTFDDVMGKRFRTTPAPPTDHKPSIPVAPKKRQPISNVKHLDPTEKADLLEFEFIEKAVLEQMDAQKEMTPSPSLKKTRSGEEDVVRGDRADGKAR